MVWLLSVLMQAQDLQDQLKVSQSEAEELRQGMLTATNRSEELKEKLSKAVRIDGDRFSTRTHSLQRTFGI